jgi:hypothetical protein
MPLSGERVGEYLPASDGSLTRISPNSNGQRSTQHISAPDEKFAALLAADPSPPAQSRKKHRSLRERLLVD